jgi:alpha-L-fucosidase
MFVHYGLYSIHGRGEWGMLWDKIPPADYNRLADEFDAVAFDADALVALAKRAGAGYVVLGARHHDGFCLWNTATTDFNTVKTAAKRDLIAEYVAACRRAGLRVGIYHSVMSWQWPAIHLPPAQAPAEWKAMVGETHAQIRELLTNYGRIDYLWYDGCVVPGLGDPEIRARVWRSHELNAMARALQPGILINDRAALPEDVTTPEQHITPAARGRLWEACMTVGDHWGWRPDDLQFKSTRTLIQHMILCARFGGNFLLNIGPHADGSLPAEHVARFEELGVWMDVNGAAIRNSERTPYTEAEHVVGPATCVGRTLYFHLSDWPEGGTARIAGIHQEIRSVQLLALGGPRELAVRQNADGTALIDGLPAGEPIETVAVLAVELTDPALLSAPPSLLIERETGRHAPSEAPVHAIDRWEMNAAQTLKFNASVSGSFNLELAVIAEQATDLCVTLNGMPLEGGLKVECGNYPVTLVLPGLSLFEGEHEIELRAVQPTRLGLYLWRLQPIWKLLGPDCWRTMGPFPGSFDPAEGTASQVRAALDHPYPPETSRFDASARFVGVGNRPIGWEIHPDAVGETVNLAALSGGDEPGLSYARAVVTSTDARDAEVLLGCDWWANLYVNGSLVETAREPDAVAADGARFNGWKPSPARIRLDRGENILLVKCHPGSTDNWFTFRINDAGDLGFSP